MKRLVFLSLAAASPLWVSNASAADLAPPVQVAPAIPAPIISPAFDWTGFYVGGNAGYGWGTAETVGTDIDVDGAFVGAQIGANYQMNNFVLGAEADIQYSWLGGDEGADGFDLDYFGTVRARVGYAFDRVLPYVTGGLAYGGGDPVGADDGTHVGWTVGGGLEYAFTDAVSVRGEYLYTDLGEESYDGDDISLDFHTIRVGVNYRF
jgi:outer membrane immunogenic protein